MPRSPYNTTDLDPRTTRGNLKAHRDIEAHFNRWCHTLRYVKRNGGQRVVDFGCGTAGQLEVLYRNGSTGCAYTGFDIRARTIAANTKRWNSIQHKIRNDFFVADLILEDDSVFEQQTADVVVSFEVWEHVGRQNTETFLRHFKQCGKPGAVYLLSTPNYDDTIGAAGNHTYDSGDGNGVRRQELAYTEQWTAIKNAGFDIVQEIGTFASQKDYRIVLETDDRLQEVFHRLRQVFDSNVVSNVMGALVPAYYGRNILWTLKAS